MEKLVIIPIVFGLLFIITIVFAVSKSSNFNVQSRSGGRGTAGRTNVFATWPNDEIPVFLGVPYGHPARTAAERLESALSQDFESRVKDRVLKQSPNMSDKEWDWTWFELKRYFLMCAILNNVPMYSRQVDAVWHEMLMFTREYEQFCMSFSGDMIHHAPHAPGAQPLPGERAMFDFAYGELFGQAPASGRLWGAFYRSRMPEQRLEELAGWSKDELRKHWFNVRTTAKYDDLGAAADYMIDRAKEQFNDAVSGIKPQGKYSGNYAVNSALGATGLLSALLIYNSISHPTDFVQQMDQAQNEEQRNANGSGGSTYACSGSSDDGRNHSGGSDGGDGGSGGHSSCGGSGGDGGGGGGSSCGGGGCGSS